MSEKIIEQVGGEQRTRWYRRGEVWTSIGVVAFAGSFVAGQLALMNADEKSAKRAEVFSGQMADRVAQDDFMLLSVQKMSDDMAQGSIRITPNCSLDEVAMHYERTPDGKVADVTDYSFSTVLNGVVSSRYNTAQKRQEPIVTGAPVTLTFTSREDLMQNVLGDTPCATLAQNVTVIEQNR